MIFSGKSVKPRYWTKNPIKPPVSKNPINPRYEQNPMNPRYLGENLLNPRYWGPKFFLSLMWTCPDGARLLRHVAPRCRAPHFTTRVFGHSAISPFLGGEHVRGANFLTCKFCSIQGIHESLSVIPEAMCVCVDVSTLCSIMCGCLSVRAGPNCVPKT